MPRTTFGSPNGSQQNTLRVTSPETIVIDDSIPSGQILMEGREDTICTFVVGAPGF